MLNYETLLSNYDDRLTLLEYLKKVEAALADASATSFSVTKTGNATLKFVLTFADGSTLESPEIVLQQGESVASAAIVNGHLILTLTNGDELDAGSMFDGSVSISGDLSVMGFTHVDNMQAHGDVEISGDTEINGAVQINSDVTATGDLSAANITGDSIIENMTGYSAQILTPADYTIEPVYVGAVKNGNKLTLVCAVNITKTDAGANNQINVCRVNLPAAVMSKLYAATISGDLDNRVNNAFSSTIQSVSVPSYLQKYTSYVVFSGAFSNLVAGTKYYWRYEATFLLSDNLAA